MLRVHSIETFGTHEGPGIRMVIFLQGCMLRCLYCHNPDTWKTTGGTEYTDEKIVEQAIRMRPYFKSKGGITVSGGEPLMQRHQLIGLFTKLKSHKIHTALDTNGFFLDDDTKKLLAVTDLVLLDVKHINPHQHKKLTSVSVEPILAFAKYCQEINKPVWLRYVLVPGHTDQPEYLHEWGAYFKPFKNIERVEILPYHTFGVHKYTSLQIPYPLQNVQPPSHNQILSAKHLLLTYFNSVYVR